MSFVVFFYPWQHDSIVPFELNELNLAAVIDITHAVVEVSGMVDRGKKQVLTFLDLVRLEGHNKHLFSVVVFSKLADGIWELSIGLFKHVVVLVELVLALQEQLSFVVHVSGEALQLRWVVKNCLQGASVVDALVELYVLRPVVLNVEDQEVAESGSVKDHYQAVAFFVQI